MNGGTRSPKLWCLLKFPAQTNQSGRARLSTWANVKEIEAPRGSQRVLWATASSSRTNSHPARFQLRAHRVRAGIQGVYMNDNENRTVKKAVEARGARLGRPVLVVLIVSLVAVMGILSLIFYGNFG